MLIPYTYIQDKGKAQRHLLSAVEGHSTRRLLEAGTDVDVEVKAKNEKEAKKASEDLTQDNINKELSAAGQKFGKSKRSSLFRIQYHSGAYLREFL